METGLERRWVGGGKCCPKHLTEHLENMEGKRVSTGQVVNPHHVPQGASGRAETGRSHSLGSLRVTHLAESGSVSMLAAGTLTQAEPLRRWRESPGVPMKMLQW